MRIIKSLAALAGGIILIGVTACASQSPHPSPATETTPTNTPTADFLVCPTPQPPPGAEPIPVNGIWAWTKDNGGSQHRVKFKRSEFEDGVTDAERNAALARHGISGVYAWMDDPLTGVPILVNFTDAEWEDGTTDAEREAAFQRYLECPN